MVCPGKIWNSSLTQQSSKSPPIAAGKPENQWSGLRKKKARGPSCRQRRLPVVPRMQTGICKLRIVNQIRNLLFGQNVQEEINKQHQEAARGSESPSVPHHLQLRRRGPRRAGKRR
eukprot:TRINITY_DN8703_c0_g1_i2.p1 TRINITY_DN8703_c0_g1~~TRINITY_DN8703_c0_g1_i2.p1  ORF type:complete len:116 (-),score=0.35 TRINITY_DN8703_c0_g1_i2:15-362(-)